MCKLLVISHYELCDFILVIRSVDCGMIVFFFINPIIGLYVFFLVKYFFSFEFWRKKQPPYPPMVRHIKYEVDVLVIMNIVYCSPRSSIYLGRLKASLLFNVIKCYVWWIFDTRRCYPMFSYKLEDCVFEKIQVEPSNPWLLHSSPLLIFVLKSLWSGVRLSPSLFSVGQNTPYRKPIRY